MSVDMLHYRLICCSCSCLDEKPGTAFQLMSHTLVWIEEEKPDVAFEQKKQCAASLCTPPRGDVLAPVSRSAGSRWKFLLDGKRNV